MSTASSTEGSSDDTIQLRVSDSQYRDVGKGLARISHSLMAQLDLTAGDIIEINGKITADSGITQISRLPLRKGLR